MNQQPDKFFRDKLEQYERAVSPQAWNRISENIRPQHKSMTLLRVAATAALLITATLLVYRLPDETGRDTTAKVNDSPVSPTPRPTETKDHNTSPATPETTSESPGTEVPVNPERKQLPSRKNTNQVTPLRMDTTRNLPAPLLPAHEPAAAPVLADNEGVLQETIPSTIADEAPPIRTTGITIVLDEEEVNEKYLEKKNKEVQATTREKETSGLRKLLAKARDLKHNQDPFGDLRQKKNEILALNLKNNKRHENQ